MKVIFVNAPHIKNPNANAVNNFTVTTSLLDKLRTPHTYKNMLGGGRMYNYLTRLFPRFYNGTRYGVRAGSRWPWSMERPHGGPPYPFFLGYAASYLQSFGYEVNLLDAIAEETYDYQAFLQEVKQENADIVVIECSTPTIDIDTWFAAQVSRFSAVALSGPHLNDQTIKEIQDTYPQISYYLKGEYILSTLKMVRDFESNIKSGIYESEVVKDLDSIPFPFRDYKSATKYYDPTMPTPRPQLQIYASKGCPFKCTFCSWPQNMYFGNVAQRSPEKIAEEIKQSVQTYGYKSIFFDDDTFNIGEERISKLCDYLAEIGLPWTMMGRLDCSSRELYDKMVASGCVGMRFGIETFNQDVLKNIQKGIERKDFRYTLEYLSTKYPQLMIHLTMMRDMPGQTEEMHNIDMQILSHMGYTPNGKMRNYQLSKCVPFPGTQMYKDFMQKNNTDTMNQYAKYDGGTDTIVKELQ
ncbi:B12-binding domain-containing radical SAM protein [Helicobacter japonicus]|uniref:B12-binding domain-containing radical SAM protein n=5 Tax=Helicobacter japonicus TaxID=425400 RepID=A0A4U8TP51_9HELI|nr:radical SAM protein [Helicobacter japonicus]TLE02297.1 B12-binding domain-containing radical SAM protein [Helicobacter japonicus]